MTPKALIFVLDIAAGDPQEQHVAEQAHRERVDTAARLGVDVPRLIGFHGHEAHRAAARFLRHEERTLGELVAPRREDRYIDAARRAILKRVLEADRSAPDPAVDSGWIRNRSAVRCGNGRADQVRAAVRPRAAAVR